MKKLILVTAALALAGCSGADTDESAMPAQAGMDQAGVDAVDPGADVGFEAVAPGDYEVVHADGSVDDLTIQPGMTW